ncbi:PREDICTED: proteoglycan 4 [Diuraphis noxia]|uniref:proteoglycan 4 n=1 Tax=Diuraphis noxia TaxID=143948 RepID=UPI0007639D48|nr:PREDICTED: proteoglycan 4 [Diuraphis noxia]XP_015368832.1 PREDICTED: proteoglycan 4 [Diuraphis noxia]XP_015368833.1 PREDICTED: proteoglycan 4 [Diuraphis noxia]
MIFTEMKTFTLCFVLLLAKISVFGLVNGDSSPGPVYVNPDLIYEKPEPVASQVVSPDSQITQTVYGFLDFTTTIGNTVMVFMPQSASTSPGTTTTEESLTTEGMTTTIEEKPITKEQLETESIGITPSKPVNLPIDSKNEEIVMTSNEPKTTAEITTKEPTTTTTKEPPTTKNVVKKSEQEKKSTGAPVTTKKTNAKPTTPSPLKPKLVGNVNKEPMVSSKVIVMAGSKVLENIQTKVEVIEGSTPEPSKVVEKAIYSKVEVISGEPVEEVAVNHLQPTPEYDFLSRQPSEVVDETFKVIDLKPSLSRHVLVQKSRGPDGKLRAFNSIANFNVEEEPTTNKAPKKVAVKISPSASGVRILKTAAPKPSSRSPNVEPTPAASGLDDESLESLVGSQPGSVLVRQSRRPAIGGGFNKNKYTPTPKSKSKEFEDYSTTDEEQNEFTSVQNEPTTPSYRKGSKFTSKITTTTQRVPSFKQNRFNRPTTAEPEVELTEGSATQRRFQPSSKRYDSNTNAAVVTPANRRAFKKHFQQQEQSPQSSPQPIPTAPLTFKSKLIRPTGRWEYKTSPKPRVTIRRIDENRHGQENATTPLTPHFPDVQVDNGDQALAGSGLLPALQHDDDNDVLVQDVSPTANAETIRVEISTPAEFKDIYYEIATIKSPYSFQVGSVKNTRFITVTSTIQKSLVEQTDSPSPARVEPLSENILASQAPNLYGREQPLDSSLATLPPISLSPDQATPPLETMTESFSTTELMLKTHILPVVRGTDTSSVTLVQSYKVTRLVTAVKTLPPMEVYQFVPSKTLNEFNTRLDEAGSELHLELEYGDNGNHDDEHPSAAKAFLDSLDLSNVGSSFDLSQMDKANGPRSKKAHRMASASGNSSSTEHPSNQYQQQQQQQQAPTMSPEQLQQLALYRLLNPNAPIPAPVITTSRPVLRYETVFETHALPVVNGGTTYYTTLSRPVGTVTRTDYEMVTTTLAIPQPQSLPFQPPQLQPTPLFQFQQTPLFPPQLQQQQQQQFPVQPTLFPAQPSFAITSTPVITQSMVTQTDSKVLKLTFGAKTAYTTIYSSSVVPTQVTSYVTQSVAVQPTVAQFPNFIPYGGYPFLG